MAELGEEGAREQRVDLVVLGDKDRKAAVRHAALGARRLRFGRRRLEGVVGRKARGERGGAHRPDQVAGEAGFLQRRELGAHRRRDQHDPPRDRCGEARQHFALRRARRVVDQHGAPRPLRQQRGSDLIVGHDGRSRAPALQPPCDQRRLDAAGATISTSWPARSGTGRPGSSVSPKRASGTLTRKVAPAPGMLSIAIVPPMRSTIRLEMAGPRPVPPNFRVEPPSACSNSAKIRACSSAEMPMPVSRTGNGNRIRLRGRLDDDRDAAALGELDGVAGEVEQHLAQPRRVADDARRQALVDVAADLQALRLRARPEQLDRLLDEGREDERPRREIEPAGLDLGEIEDLLDQRQQGLARRASPP